MYDIPLDRSFLKLWNGVRHVMPSTDTRRELKEKTSMAQNAWQAFVYASGLTLNFNHIKSMGHTNKLHNKRSSSPTCIHFFRTPFKTYPLHRKSKSGSSHIPYTEFLQAALPLCTNLPHCLRDVNYSHSPSPITLLQPVIQNGRDINFHENSIYIQNECIFITHYAGLKKLKYKGKIMNLGPHWPKHVGVTVKKVF